MEIASNFMKTREFFALLYMVLKVVNTYSEILGTVPDLTISDIEIEPETSDLPCPLIRLKLPLTFNSSAESPPDTKEKSNSCEIWRNYLQEYLNLLVNTNVETIHPQQPPHGCQYSPIFVDDITSNESTIDIDVYYVDNPLGYRYMEQELANRFQPKIGI